tara:strand:- start:15528 stop:15860 length:333 start_codon:yes stop_codon:yes gene_type:complete
MDEIHKVTKENFTQATMDLLNKEIKTGWNKRQFEAIQNQRAAQKFAQDFESRPIDGVGQLVLEVDTQIYNYWVQREGKEFWRDKANIKYFQRHFDEMGAPKVAKKAQIRR